MIKLLHALSATLGCHVRRPALNEAHNTAQHWHWSHFVFGLSGTFSPFTFLDRRKQKLLPYNQVLNLLEQPQFHKIRLLVLPRSVRQFRSSKNDGHAWANCNWQPTTFGHFWQYVKQIHPICRHKQRQESTPRWSFWNSNKKNRYSAASA